MRKLLLLSLVINPALAVAQPPAEAEKHWAFQPHTHPTPPQFADAKHKGWVKNPVDAFILDRLVRAGLTPAAEAIRTSLIRRVTFDLIGLPPTPDEIDAFLKDESPKAYEKLID